MDGSKNYDWVNVLLSIIGGLILLLQLIIGFIMSRVFRSLDKFEKIADDHNKLRGEHDTIMRRNNGKKE